MGENEFLQSEDKFADDEIESIRLADDGEPLVLPPTDDHIFKAMVLNPDAELVRVGIFSAFLEMKVLRTEIKNTQFPVRDNDEKNETVDARCDAYDIDENGTQISGEIQVKTMVAENAEKSKIALLNRFVYSLCDMLTTQPGRGKLYNKFMKSAQLAFLDFNFYPDKQLVHTGALRMKDGTLMTDAVKLIIVELPKVRARFNTPVNEMTWQECWAFYIRYANVEKYQSKIAEIIKSREDIHMAQDVLLGISCDPAQRAAFHSRRIAMQDKEHERVYYAGVLQRAEKAVQRAEKAVQRAEKAVQRAENAEKQLADERKASACKDAEILALKQLLAQRQ